MMKKVIPLLIAMTFLGCNETVQKPVDANITPEKIVKNQFTSYDEAMKMAKTSKKSVFILFTTQYCGWCKKLKETTLKDPVVMKRLQDEFIFLNLDRDIDTYPSAFEIQGVPTVYILSPDEEMITKIDGYREPEDYIKWFDYVKNSQDES
ncbi:MAG: hypothetical protein KN64_07490 [Sulfurovum sp. AS07-7]|nr:MAG: hypothetical protein KN64_07490 [Sulfurovum sp. AS07-7]TQV61557.1 MAG: thioredoxin family protein [Sulfurovum sp.]